MIYTVTKPKRLDEIVYQHYKTLLVLNDVLQDNKQYLNKYILQPGDKVILNKYHIKKQVVENKLWH